MTEPKSAASTRLEKLLTEAATLSAQGQKGQDKAAARLLQACAQPLSGYFQRNSVPEGEAEELACEVIFSLAVNLAKNPTPTAAWYWAIARNALISWARKRNAAIRGGHDEAGRIEVNLDEDDFANLVDKSFGKTDMPAWVRDCVQRAAHVLQTEDHRTAEVLWMVYMDYTAEDIAVHFGAREGAVTDKQKAAARERKSHALGIARGYFEPCLE